MVQEQGIDKVNTEVATTDRKCTLPPQEKDPIYYENICFIVIKVIILTDLLFVMIYIYCMIKPLNDNFIVEEFIEPCNSTNITTTFDEVRTMKNRLGELNFAISSIKFVAEYDISNHTNEYLTDKYANFSNTYNELNQTYNEQKELYFTCYKENLMEECKNKRITILRIKSCLDFGILLGVFFIALKIRSCLNLKNLDKLLEEKHKEHDAFLAQPCQNETDLGKIRTIMDILDDEWYNLLNKYTKKAITERKVRSILLPLIWLQNICLAFNVYFYYFISIHVSEDLISKFPF